jgi:hypothetical protein
VAVAIGLTAGIDEGLEHSLQVGVATALVATAVVFGVLLLATGGWSDSRTEPRTRTNPTRGDRST